MSASDWSVPEADVYDRIRTVVEQGTDAVLATVVDVEGSAYRRPGAKMLVEPEGGGAGSITAGCLEDEVRGLAVDVLAEGGPRVETWDLTGDDGVWGMGVGCNGVITVLLEPLDDSYLPALDARAGGEPVGLVTVVGGDLPVGTRGYFRPGAGFSGDLPDWLTAELVDAADSLVADGSSETVAVETAEGAVDVFVDGVAPPPHLVVFGSGHDVIPVTEFARQVDFRVTVVGYRGAHATAERFPAADEVVSTSPRDAAEAVAYDEDTYAVVMSHNFLDDCLTLEALLDTPVAYVGLMGPRERFEELREELADDGVSLSAADRERIHTPVGLDLGGGTPHQIAFSIVAELLAVANDRSAGHLADVEGPIHDRIEH